MKEAKREELRERLAGGEYGRSTAHTRYAAFRVVKRAMEKGHIRRPRKCSACGREPGLDSQGNPMIQAVFVNGYSPENRFDFHWMCVSCRNVSTWAKQKSKDGKGESDERCS